MNQLFQSILKNMRETYNSTLKFMFPTALTNKEANLTSYFLKAFSKLDPHFFVSYDELPVAEKFRPGKSGDKNSDALDSVFYFPNENNLLIVESKEKMNPWNSITWDILRANNVACSPDVFPRVLKDLNGNCLGIGYNTTTVFGVILCGHWSHSYVLSDAKNEVIHGLESATNPNLGDHKIEESNVLLERVQLRDPEQLRQGWNYYLVLYYWKINKPTFLGSGFCGINPPKSTALKNMLISLLYPFANILGPDKISANAKNWYLQPPCLQTQSRQINKEKKIFSIWTPLNEKANKIVVLCGLSSREKQAILTMPKGWVKDVNHDYNDGTFKNNYVFELGFWNDLETAEGCEKISERLKKLAESVSTIQIR